MLPDITNIERRILAGTTLEALESRLKPANEGSTWSDASGGGFLAPNERLLEVVRADYETLVKMGKSYEEMAQVADRVLRQGREEKAWGNARNIRGGVRNLLRWYKERKIRVDEKKFDVIYACSAGRQGCPWNCTEDRFGYRTQGSGHALVMSKGKEHYNLMEAYLAEIERSDREDTSVEERKQKKMAFERRMGIEFGGIERMFYLSSFTVVTDLTPHLIASHYFFQGDASYRTDPEKVVALFVGK